MALCTQSTTQPVHTGNENTTYETTTLWDLGTLAFYKSPARG